MTLHTSPISSEIVLCEGLGSALYARVVRGRSLAWGGGTKDLWGRTGARSRHSDADTYTLVSTSIEDTYEGGGAHEVEFVGIDEGGFEAAEIVRLNGAEEVSTTRTYACLNELCVASAGKGGGGFGGANLGTLTAAHSRLGDVQGVIKPGEGRAFHSHYRIPDNCVGYVDWVSLTNDPGNPALFQLMSGDVDACQIQQEWRWIPGVLTTPIAPIQFPGGTDLWVVITAETYVGEDDHMGMDYRVVLREL